MPRAANPKTRETLLDAAEDLMLARGFAATSVDDICEAAKLTKGSFFHYFDSKEQAGVEAIQRFYSRMSGAVAAAAFRKRKDPIRRIVGYLDFLIEFGKSDAGARGCLIGSLAQELAATNGPIRAACSGCFDDWATQLRSDLEQARRSSGARFHPQGLAEHCIAVVEGALVLGKTRRDAKVVVQSLSHLKRYFSFLFEK